jgi:hypothetical protein
MTLQHGALSLDRDTHREPRMGAVADTILRKIDEAAIFAADLTFVAQVGPKGKGRVLNCRLRCGIQHRSVKNRHP